VFPRFFIRAGVGRPTNTSFYRQWLAYDSLPCPYSTALHTIFFFLLQAVMSVIMALNHLTSNPNMVIASVLGSKMKVYEDF